MGNLIGNIVLTLIIVYIIVDKIRWFSDPEYRRRNGGIRNNRGSIWFGDSHTDSFDSHCDCDSSCDCDSGCDCD